jgi:hypothetical protein
VDAGFFVYNYPTTLGFNSSGTVAEVGPDVHDLKVGDRVSDRSRSTYTQLRSILRLLPPASRNPARRLRRSTIFSYAHSA